jgi:hypothetical protein
MNRYAGILEVSDVDVFLLRECDRHIALTLMKDIGAASDLMMAADCPSPWHWMSERDPSMDRFHRETSD